MSLALCLPDGKHLKNGPAIMIALLLAYYQLDRVFTMSVLYYPHSLLIGVFIFFIYFFTVSGSNGALRVWDSQEYLQNERIFETMERLQNELLTNPECAVLGRLCTVIYNSEQLKSTRTSNIGNKVKKLQHFLCCGLCCCCCKLNCGILLSEGHAYLYCWRG